MVGLLASVALALHFAESWQRAVLARSEFRYQPGDPRNIHYILWKRGIDHRINLDTAMAAFYLDRERDRLEIGASEIQLKNRFGYIRPLEEVSPYYQQCLCQSPTRQGKTAVFLRDTAYMVVMDRFCAKGTEEMR